MAELKYLDATGLSHYHGKIKAYIDAQISSAGHLKRLVVDALPAVSDADPDTIYLVKRAAGQSADDVHDEYLLIDGKFELIGNTTVSFEGYSTTEEVEGMISTAKSEAIAAAASDATSKAGAAEAAAKSYADTKKAEAINAAAADATTKAGAAETAAKAYTDQQIGALDTTAAISIEDIDALFAESAS